MTYLVTYADGHRAVLTNARPKQFEQALAEEQRRGKVREWKHAWPTLSPAAGADLAVRIDYFHIHRVHDSEIVNAAAWRHPQRASHGSAPLNREHETTWLMRGSVKILKGHPQKVAEGLPCGTANPQ